MLLGEWFDYGTLQLPGGEIVVYGLVWALMFLRVSIFEETALCTMLPPITMANGGGHPMTDYKIEPDGKLVIFLRARSTAGSGQSRDNSGAKVSFQNKQETAEFVRAGECHGFTFDGKEFLVQHRNLGEGQSGSGNRRVKAQMPAR